MQDNAIVIFEMFSTVTTIYIFVPSGAPPEYGSHFGAMAGVLVQWYFIVHVGEGMLTNYTSAYDITCIGRSD